MFDPAKHMRTSEVTRGMKGYGLSVFAGTKVERFDVEVISVLHDQMGPKKDVVLIRCRGQGLEHSGAVAGMSGSPIFLTGVDGRERMIGAFALGWSTSKDPIAGVRPIEEMLAVPTDRRVAPATLPADGARAAGRPWDARPLMRSVLGAAGAHEASPLRSAPLPGTSVGDLHDADTALRPLTVPLSLRGADLGSMSALLPLASDQRFTLLQSGAATAAPADAAEARLERGAAIGVPVVSGDLDLAAIGTVTEIIGNEVFAFGHEFQGEGGVELPMGVGYVHTIIPSIVMSFKLGAVLHTDGTIYSDNAVAVAGRIGAVPATIPVRVTVSSAERSGAELYQFQVTRHPSFTPMGANMALVAAIMGHAKLPPEATLGYTIDTEFEGGHKLSTENVTTSLSQYAELVRDLSLPMQFAMANPFARAYPTKITARFDITPAVEASTLQGVTTDKSAYKPGETVRVRVTRRAWMKGEGGAERSDTFDVPLPAALPDGPVQLTVSDATRYMADSARFAPNEFHADDLAGVFGMTRAITSARSDRLYTRLVTTGESLAVGRAALADLPASRRKLLSGEVRTGVTAFPRTYVRTFDLGQPVVGAADVQLMIARDPARAPRQPAPATPALPTAPLPQPDKPTMAD